MSASVCSLRVAIIIWDINWSVSWYWAGQTSLNKEVNLGHYTQSTEFKQNTIKNIFFSRKLFSEDLILKIQGQMLYDGLVWWQGDCPPVHPAPPLAVTSLHSLSNSQAGRYKVYLQHTSKLNHVFSSKPVFYPMSFNCQLFLVRHNDLSRCGRICK